MRHPTPLKYPDYLAHCTRETRGGMPRRQRPEEQAEIDDYNLRMAQQALYISVGFFRIIERKCVANSWT